MFSYRRTLKTWLYPHLLPRAVLWPRAAAAPAMQQSIDITYPPGPQQQTLRTLLQRANGTDKRTDSVPFHKPCSAYYAGSANKTVKQIFTQTSSPVNYIDNSASTMVISIIQISQGML